MSWGTLDKPFDYEQGFHWQDGWHFLRMPNGNVRVWNLRCKDTWTSTVVAFEVPAAEWESIQTFLKLAGTADPVASPTPTDEWHCACGTPFMFGHRYCYNCGVKRASSNALRDTSWCILSEAEQRLVGQLLEERGDVEAGFVTRVRKQLALATQPDLTGTDLLCLGIIGREHADKSNAEELTAMKLYLERRK